jgi:putative nucleotidyltransferase with HDIG domain
MDTLREVEGAALPQSGFHRWSVRGRLLLAALVLLALSTYLLSFPLLSSGRLTLEEGDVAPRDIRSPYRITYESAIRTEVERQRAEAAVAAVYSPPDRERANQALERTRQVLDFLVAVRADPFATAAQRRAWVLAVPELADLPPALLDGLFALSEESWSRVQLEVQAVVAEMMRRGVRDGALAQARQEAQLLVGVDLTTEEAMVTTALAQRLIVANSFYDEAATQAARQQAREAVPVVLRTFEAGEVIIREGQRVRAEDVEALQRLGLQQPRTRWNDVAGYGLLAAAGIAVLGLSLAAFRPAVLLEGRQTLLLSLLLLLFLLIARLMIPDRTVLRYLFPGPALAALATITLGLPVGVVTSLLMGVAAGLMAANSLEMAAYVGAGGLVAALTLRGADRPAALFRSAVFVALAQGAVLLGFRMSLDPAEFMPLETTLDLMMAAVGAVLSASIALGGLFLIAPLFDIVTTFRLVELSRPDHPLLQRMLREAPGTYHHSLMVASLAEQAAEKIGADPLLVRVGAYYHDIGKMVHPYFFGENQMEGANPHDRLDPYDSVAVIIGHVRDGIELARRYRLPSRVRAFIPEHHGTNRASFQYERAVEQAGDASRVNEASFRHKGPRPRSKETALVMLADSTEATVRSARPATPEELAEVVRRVFDRLVAAHQLDEAPLTMRELDVVRETFVSALKGAYHPRVRYPEPLVPPTVGQAMTGAMPEQTRGKA